MRQPLATLVLWFGTLTGCAAGPAVLAPAGDGPTMIVFLTIDQLHPDYLERYRSEFTGGLDRLLRGGAVFTAAYQDHAITETAPGHAGTMSGRHPRSTGITRNIRGVGDPNSPLIGSIETGASPYRFRGTTLYDWIRAVDPGARAFSVSMKDRGAILPIGRAKQQIYWFSDGLFTTSSWYADTLPDWVTAFNARRVAQRMAGQTWNLLRNAATYSEPDTVSFEFFGRWNTFPHVFPADTVSATSLFRITPMMDQLTVEFALRGLDALGIGRGPSMDVMAVSLSATDGVGHYWGPESREIHDQVLRLDRALGQLLDSLFRTRDSTRILVALTADHAVAPIPELHGGLRVDMKPAMVAARAAVAAAGGDTAQVDLESGAFFAGDVGREAGITAFIAAAWNTPGIVRIDRYSDLRRMDLTTDKIARRWINMFSADLEPLVVVTLEPGNMYDYPIVATHGSPHDYDAHVPMIFYGPAFTPGQYDEFVRVIDMGPTLARAIGVRALEPLDGRPLTQALR